MSVGLALSWRKARGRQQEIVGVGNSGRFPSTSEVFGRSGCWNRDVLVSAKVQGKEGRSWERERVQRRVPVDAHHLETDSLVLVLP